MKRSREDEEDAGGTPGRRQYKYLKGAQLPKKIEALPHVMKRIDAFAMPVEEVALEAAATRAFAPASRQDGGSGAYNQRDRSG
jgi:hypothetical protein